MANPKPNTKGGTINAKCDAKAYVAAHGYPELSQFEDENSLQKFYKKLDMAQITEWLGIEGLTYAACPEQPAIDRMRACMALLYKRFPKQTKAKPESPYKKYSLEDLINMALENDVVVEPTPDEKIMRMRTIMALKVKGVLA